MASINDRVLGMTVREVVELPPTDTLGAKAAELGSSVPAGISSDELSGLISLTTWRDKTADAALRELAAGYGVAVNSYSGKTYLSPLGWEHINQSGDYVWRSSAKLGAGKFWPLRPLQPA